MIALDGEWGRPASELFGRLSLSASRDFGPSASAQQLPFLPLRGPGFERIAVATFTLGESNQVLRIEGLGLSIALAVGCLPNRATIVGVILRPDGSFDVSNNILRVPGQSYDEPPVGPYQEVRLVRMLQIGQKLYSAGELAAPENSVPISALYAKWLDPIVGCMAYYVGRRDHLWPSLLPMAAANLRRYFGDLADARLIAQLQGNEARFGLGDAIPVLAESVRAAASLGVPGSDAMADLAGRITPGQPWTLIAR